jgi:hypothetical protein
MAEQAGPDRIECRADVNKLRGIEQSIDAAFFWRVFNPGSGKWVTRQGEKAVHPFGPPTAARTKCTPMPVEQSTSELSADEGASVRAFVTLRAATNAALGNINGRMMM